MLPVVYMPMAKRYFKKLKSKSLKNAYREAILSIRKNPSIGEAKTGDLKGLSSINIYHNSTNYELAYRTTLSF